MLELCQSWGGWNCQPLQGKNALVLRFDGMPPESAFSPAPDTGQVEVLFCCFGGLHLELPPSRKLDLRPGQVLFLPGRAQNCLCHFFQEHFLGILVCGNEENLRTTLAALCPELPSSPPDQQHGCKVVSAALWSKSLFDTLGSLPEHLQGDYCCLKVLELLYLLHASAPVSHPAKFHYYDPYQIQTVERIHDYLLEHLEERLTIPQLAERFHISGTMLKTCFRQIYGVPVHQYLLERRMERAAELLVHTDQTVIQIAAAVGYGSTSQFGVTFKTFFQMPPTQYRHLARTPVKRDVHRECSED